MPDPALMIWIDFESTGLLTDPIPPTLLEASWVVTDPAGRQLTPMRHRFTALCVRPGTGVITPVVELNLDGSTEIGWSRPFGATYADYPAPVVRDMHRDNGLTAEWLDACTRTECGGDGPLRTRWAAIADQIGADLGAAGWDQLGERQVLLAGGGVSHYEHRFLSGQAPTVFADPRMHYSAGADISIVLRTLRTRIGRAWSDFPGTVGHVIDWAREGHLLDALLEAGPLVLEAAWPAAHRDDAAAWVRADRDNHRAHWGVARALTAYRLLPGLLADVGARHAAAYSINR